MRTENGDEKKGKREKERGGERKGEGRGACYEIFGKSIFLKLTDVVTFPTNIIIQSGKK